MCWPRALPRARESAPEVARRLRRLEDEPVAGADVVRIDNDGPVERAGEAFVRTVEDALSAGRSGSARNAV